MAVLADDSTDWKPQQWGYEVLGCRHMLEFPVAKLMDYATQQATLADHPNPFALVTLAHLQTKATRKDPQSRFEAKWKLVQLLYRRGWEKQQILQRLLAKRFGPLQASMIATIDAASITDIEAWFDKAIDASSLSEVFIL